VVGFSGEHVVLVDANVWVSRNLRDWVCALYVHSDAMFTVVWTEDILAETLHAVRRLYPDLEGGKIAHVRESIVGIFKDGQVRDFTVDVDRPISDPYDRHVHAAAMAGDVDILVTNNIKDLRPARQEDQDALPYEVYTADEFFMLIADCQPDVVRDAIRDQISYFIKRGADPNLPARLRQAGAPDFAERVRRVQLDMEF
jgi:predicted nucleic acid-binding protein